MTIRGHAGSKKIPDDRSLLEKVAFRASWMGKSGEPNGRGILSIDEPCATITRRHPREHPGDGYIAHSKDEES